MQNNKFPTIANNAGKTASLKAIQAIVDAQTQIEIARWKVARQGDRKLHLKFRRKSSNGRSSRTASKL
jgi:hypothetical protein